MVKGFVATSVLLAVMAFGACTVHQSDTPSLTGPSQLALALSVLATPDSINRDGASQSSIKVTAQSASGGPASGLPIHLDMLVNGTVQDFGTLSARNIVTDTNGVALAVFTAPLPQPPAQCCSISIVTVRATPSGSNALVSSVSREFVDIRLVPPGIIIAPGDTPTAAFTETPLPATAGVPLHFDASTSLPCRTLPCAGATQIVSYNWDFGDATSATGVNPTHTFSAAGSYTVTLTVTNDRGIPGSITQVILVAPAATPTPPTATFTFSPASPGVNETVFFNGSSSTAGLGHTISSYSWTFGDGHTATGANVSHAFATAGTYTVQLTVTDEIGQSNTSGGTQVGVGAPPGPTSNFTISPANPNRGDLVVFDASSSLTSQGQTITNLAWNFGDGTPIVSCPGDANCNGTRIISHTFTNAGTFVVNLVVTDSAGRIGSHSAPVSVGSGNPLAVATFSPSAPTHGVTSVQFDSSGSSASNNATITGWAWTFGDGASSAAQNPTHTFAAAGSFTVRLTVTDSLGRTGTTTVTVTVN
jgi:PKD repeat protein